MPRFYIAQAEEDTEGQRKMRILRPAEDDEVQGLAKFRILETDDDTAGQGRGRSLGETENDTVGHPKMRISPEPIDSEQGAYVVEVDTNEDVTGQVYRERSPRPGGEDGQGSV